MSIAHSTKSCHFSCELVSPQKGDGTRTGFACPIPSYPTLPLPECVCVCNLLMLIIFFFFSVSILIVIYYHLQSSLLF